MKIVSIVGARPQFIKCAAVSRELRKIGTEVLVHTGQHYDDAMSNVFFRELGIPEPNEHLGVGSGSHGAQTGKMLSRIEHVLIRERPDYVLVYGDTNSTLAGALAASKLHVPLVHVEAGLRSYNRRMPEEVNRVLTDHAATLNFCPTEIAVSNLAREGIRDGVHLVGDVMYDATLYYGERAAASSAALKRLNLQAKSYVLATVHRAENTDVGERLRVIIDGLLRIARRLPVVLPVHPRTRAAMQRNELWQAAEAAIKLIDPVGYLDMVMLESNAKLIATDSGGVQKEAFFFHVPCVTLRDETEWVELVETGWNQLLSPVMSGEFAAALSRALDRPVPQTAPAIYGRGDAAVRLTGIIGASNPTAAIAVNSAKAAA